MNTFINFWYVFDSGKVNEAQHNELENLEDDIIKKFDSIRDLQKPRNNVNFTQRDINRGRYDRFNQRLSDRLRAIIEDQYNQTSTNETAVA